MTHNFNSLIKDREESIQSAYTFFFPMMKLIIICLKSEIFSTLSIFLSSPWFYPPNQEPYPASFRDLLPLELRISDMRSQIFKCIFYLNN